MTCRASADAACAAAVFLGQAVSFGVIFATALYVSWWATRGLNPLSAPGWLGRSWLPLHKIETRKVTQERPATIFERLNLIGNTVTTTSTEYVVEQDYEWPPSVVQLTLESDGIAPGASLLLYLIPLQVRAVLVAIVAMTRESNYLKRDPREFSGHGAVKRECRAVREIGQAWRQGTRSIV